MTSPHKILVANRGEIAVRILRSCKKMKLPTVAVYSEPDRTSMHVAMADEAVCIGPAATNQSYLVIENILKACQQTGATAVHPGFGFLSENEDFAEACEKAGIIFIGPSADSIRVMGNKIQARRQMKAAGVPIVPGTVEPIKSVDEAQKIAKEIGFPVMLKAAAGGGGKGMRKVDTADQLPSLFAEAQSEAKKFFADDSMYMEKFVVNPHHIEVQVFGFGKERACHLFERECSIQRRNQKVIEEAPSPLVNESIRKKLTQVAVDGAKAIGYLGAGTMEFVADNEGNFYFMEMNTRLQVEHTVTEWITGVDLVEEQLRLALKMPALLKKQEDLKINGHSLQCRIYAEDSLRFFPSPGPLPVVRWPQGPFVRVDTASDQGSEISMFYDPMIAKVTTWGRTRDEAIARMRVALEETVILGIETNIPFHLAVLQEPTFQKGTTTTGYIDEFFPAARRKDLVFGAVADAASVELGAEIAVQHVSKQQSILNPVSAVNSTSAWKREGLSRSLRMGAP